MDDTYGFPDFQRISKKAVRLFFMQGLIQAAFYLFIAVIVTLVFGFPWLFIPAGSLSLYALFVHPTLEYKQWRYRMTERYVDIVHGIFFTTHTHIPITRIQHLDISQGPLQKGLGLASIVIVTAGMSHKIQSIDWAQAQELSNEIRDRIYKEKAYDCKHPE